MTIKEIITAVRAKEIDLDDHLEYRTRLVDWARSLAAMVKNAEQDQVENYAKELDEALLLLIDHGNATDEEIGQIKDLAKRSSFQLSDIPEKTFA
ncbi:hypothetical protein [Jiulongibacter sp. NS-SX5]|uniref:hypothetical protein n=1 Tax=Jiulongibacter sp. NS-SX5 TaxID=3463854 RepID=UPI00405995C4